ncbi:MAG TPA: hypothetical protein VF476_00365 [Chitinophagaceae bacterium]
MKKLFFIGALVLATGFVLFSSFAEKKNKKFSRAWFHCIDTENPELAASYEYMDGQSPSCSGIEDVCAVYADVANPEAATSLQYPVELEIDGNGASLEELGEDSEGFTEETDDVKLLLD